MSEQVGADEELYEVMGGQGQRRIGYNLTRTEAEEVKRRFDERCFEYGLENPPTLVQRQTYGRAR